MDPLQVGFLDRLSDAEEARDRYKRERDEAREWLALAREVLDPLRSKVTYYEETLCLPGSPYKLTSGAEALEIQPVTVGSLVKERDTARTDLAQAVGL